MLRNRVFLCFRGRFAGVVHGSVFALTLAGPPSCAGLGFLEGLGRVVEGFYRDSMDGWESGVSGHLGKRTERWITVLLRPVNESLPAWV